MDEEKQEGTEQTSPEAEGTEFDASTEADTNEASDGDILSDGAESEAEVL